ncbi:hypothetical protein AwPolaro_03400 [Polaromonas sp.]|nr:hypothetical protein AwPolaro_03400 [Polaromonas sp.]
MRFLIDECLSPELVQLAHVDDLVNQALEVFEFADGSVALDIYTIPDPE